MSGEMDTARQADLFRQRAFRDAMGLFPTGVTLVTARGPDGLTVETGVALRAFDADLHRVFVGRRAGMVRAQCTGLVDVA